MQARCIHMANSLKNKQTKSNISDIFDFMETLGFESALKYFHLLKIGQVTNQHKQERRVEE